MRNEAKGGGGVRFILGGKAYSKSKAILLSRGQAHRAGMGKSVYTNNVSCEYASKAG